MHCLYNIHTHHNMTNVVDRGDYDVKSLVNVCPFDFKKQKEEYLDASFSCGIHPWYSDDFEKQLQLLDDIIADSSVAAVGEAGLDKLRGLEMTTQKDIFRHHVKLSEAYQKPLIIHCVKAWDDLISVFKSEKPSMPWVLHGFRGNLPQMKQLASMGFYFSIGAYYNESTVKAIPSDRLFCETDMSELSIYQVYERVASTRGVLMSQLISLIDSNVKMTFCK